MNLQTLSGGYSPQNYKRIATDQNGKQERSSHSTSSSHTNYVRLPSESCIYSGGDGLGQSVYAEYTKDSTTEDPIVRITGNSLSGSFDREIHINDIDPSYASFAEMCALIGHLKETGAYQNDQLSNNMGLISPLPLDVNRGNYSQKQDFMQLMKSSTSHNQQTGNTQMYRSGASLLSVFQGFLNQKEDRPSSLTLLNAFAESVWSTETTLSNRLIAQAV